MIRAEDVAAKARSPRGFFQGIAAAVLIILIAVSGWRTLGDPGVGWHIKTGEIIEKSGKVPHLDPFLHGRSEVPWICNQWLADYGAWKLYEWGGGRALDGAAFLIIIIAHVLIPFLIMSSCAGTQPVRIFSLLLIAATASVQWIFRPVLLGFLLFSCLYFFLWLRAKERKVIRTGEWFSLGGIFVLWANVHPSFPLGWGMLVLFVFLYSKSKVRDILFACIIFSLTLLNPSGVQLHMAGLGLAGDPFFRTLNREWLPPELSEPLFWPFFAVIVFVLLGSVTRVGSSRWNSRFELLLFFIFAIGALTSRRLIPFFAIAAAAPLVLQLDFFLARITKISRNGTILPHRGFILPLAATVVGAGSIIFTPLGTARGMDEFFPEKIFTRLEERVPLTGPIFHSPNLGGYATFRLWPRLYAWIDDRNEVNGRAAYEKFFLFSHTRENWRSAFEAEGFCGAVVQDTDPLFKVLTLDPEWQQITRDKQWVLFLKNTPPC